MAEWMQNAYLFFCFVLPVLLGVVFLIIYLVDPSKLRFVSADASQGRSPPSAPPSLHARNVQRLSREFERLRKEERKGV